MVQWFYKKKKKGGFEELSPAKVMDEAYTDSVHDNKKVIKKLLDLLFSVHVSRARLLQLSANVSYT